MQIVVFGIFWQRQIVAALAMQTTLTFSIEATAATKSDSKTKRAS
jgi:hypothetical protein